MSTAENSARGAARGTGRGYGPGLPGHEGAARPTAAVPFGGRPSGGRTEAAASGAGRPPRRPGGLGRLVGNFLRRR